MAKNSFSKTGSSEIEEIYFLKENEKLIQKIHEKNKVEDKNANNVVDLFLNQKTSPRVKKKAA